MLWFVALLTDKGFRCLAPPGCQVVVWFKPLVDDATWYCKVAAKIEGQRKSLRLALRVAQGSGDCQTVDAETICQA